jgi:hypothetical protein
MRNMRRSLLNFLCAALGVLDDRTGRNMVRWLIASIDVRRGVA